MDKNAAMVMNTDGSVVFLTLGADRLSSLQALVGGWVQALDLPDGTATAWMNEEGKILGLPANEGATAFMEAYGMLFPGDWIAGPLVLTLQEG